MHDNTKQGKDEKLIPRMLPCVQLKRTKNLVSIAYYSALRWSKKTCKTPDTFQEVVFTLCNTSNTENIADTILSINSIKQWKETN